MHILIGVIPCLLAWVSVQDPDPKKQQERIEALEKTVKELQDKAGQGGQQPPGPAPTPGQQAPVPNRQSLDDKQDPAPRIDGLAMDPKWTGYFMIPNTPVIMKFNAKPRVDMTWDNRNAGDDNRFITARIPIEDTDAYGGGARMNINAKGSQLRVDARAPGVAGEPRFYYQNDFFGSGGGEFPYRIQHLYGQIYNVTVGHTYSVFEDPDVWPDTVDYEGPNSMVFARRALVRYEHGFKESPFSATVGVEQPESLPTDLETGDPDGSVVGINHLPDFTAAGRYTGDWGYARLSGIARYLGADSSTFGRDETFAWGLNASAVINFGPTTISLQVTIGEGIGTLGNDSGFSNTDIAFDDSGDLTTLPYLAYMVAATHRWNEEFRSTFSYGFVNVSDGDATLDATTYKETMYASANVIWQLRKKLSVGAEVLYGFNENQGDEEGDVYRVQIGLVYSLLE